MPDETEQPRERGADDPAARAAEEPQSAAADAPDVVAPAALAPGGPGSGGLAPAAPATRASGCLAVVAYTVSRLVLLLVCWLPLQLFTPMRGLIALAIAVLVSGVLSYFLLDRRRDAMAAQLGSFFSRLNSRIDRSTKAEDDD